MCRGKKIENEAKISPITATLPAAARENNWRIRVATRNCLRQGANSSRPGTFR
jgi:hypothetical protein